MKLLVKSAQGGGLYRLAAVGLLASGSAALADEGPGAGKGVCEIYHESQSGFVSIEPSPGPSSGAPLYVLELEREEASVGEDGSRSSFSMSGLFRGDLTAERVPVVLDNLMVTLRFGDATAVDAPAMVYYTRDNTIPLDVAPGKLWYPDFAKRHDTLQIAVTYGDLERHMDFGPDHGPAQTLSWIAKKVGTGFLDDDLIASGDIPLAPVRNAIGEIETALQRWLIEHDPAAC